MKASDERTQTVVTLKDRLNEIIGRSGLSRAAFAKRLGIDRSTLSQVLAGDGKRLPRAETLAAIARDRKVSVDWLLGLTQQGGLGADVLTQPLEIAPGGLSPADERLNRWHSEATGYKIRYVPSTLPDLFKNEAVIRYEYHTLVEPVSASRIEVQGSDLTRMRIVRFEGAAVDSCLWPSLQQISGLMIKTIRNVPGR